MLRSVYPPRLSATLKIIDSMAISRVDMGFHTGTMLWALLQPIQGSRPFCLTRNIDRSSESWTGRFTTTQGCRCTTTARLSGEPKPRLRHKSMKLEPRPELWSPQLPTGGKEEAPPHCAPAGRSRGNWKFLPEFELLE